jgi:lantibiotic modifying enzyme
MGDDAGVSGFAHGVAGIGAAMARLHRLGVDDYSQYISGAMNYEMARYDTTTMGWLIPVADGHDQGAGKGWCYGGPGVLLAVLEAMTAGVAVSQDVLGLAVDNSRRSFITADGLCHGNAGTAAILHRFGSQSGDQQLVDEGRSRLVEIAQRFLSGAGLRVEPTSSLSHSGGMMCGSTGIGLAVISPEAASIASGLLAVSGLTR